MMYYVMSYETGSWIFRSKDLEDIKNYMISANWAVECGECDDEFYVVDENKNSVPYWKYMEV